MGSVGEARIDQNDTKLMEGMQNSFKVRIRQVKYREDFKRKNRR